MNTLRTILLVVSAGACFDAPGSSVPEHGDEPGSSATEQGDELPCDLVKMFQGAASPESIASNATPLVRFPEELDWLLASEANSPLHKLTPEDYRLFRDSLIANEYGITSFRYVELKRSLSPAEYLQVRELFGNDTDKDYVDYKCS